VQIAWTGLRESSADIHTASGHAVEAVMQLSLQRKSLDNVTVVLVALPGLRLTEAVSRD
jgi:serine/threonine protein phosphatase PrpC